MGDFYYIPTPDGKLLRDLPSNELKAGHFSRVPLLTDHDAWEGVLFSDQNITTDAGVQAALQKLWPSASTSFFNRLGGILPNTSFTNASFFNQPYFNSTAYKELADLSSNYSTSNPSFWRLQTLTGYSIVNCPTYYLGSAYADAGLPTWKLDNSAGSQLHASTDLFLLNAAGTGGTNTTLASIYKDYFLSFIMDLDPNTFSRPSGTERPYWPTYLSTDGNFTVLQTNDTIVQVVGDEDAAALCDFFSSQSTVTSV